MNKGNEVLEQVARTRAAQKANGLPTPDDLAWPVIVATKIKYDKDLDGFVTTRKAYKFRQELKKAGFVWKNKTWLKNIN